MRHTEEISCNLPLLDGEDNTKPQLLMTELELENADLLQNLGNGDFGTVSDLLCTAWGLLLRCYTGQDRVSFLFRESKVDGLRSDISAPRDRQSLFRMVFDEQESLSTCCARAKDGYACNEWGDPSLVSTGSNPRSFSASTNQNTNLWVQDISCNDARDVAVRKVRNNL